MSHARPGRRPHRPRSPARAEAGRGCWRDGDAGFQMMLPHPSMRAGQLRTDPPAERRGAQARGATASRAVDAMCPTPPRSGQLTTSWCTRSIAVVAVGRSPISSHPACPKAGAAHPRAVSWTSTARRCAAGSLAQSEPGLMPALDEGSGRIDCGRWRSTTATHARGWCHVRPPQSGTPHQESAQRPQGIRCGGARSGRSGPRAERGGSRPTFDQRRTPAGAARTWCRSCPPRVRAPGSGAPGLSPVYTQPWGSSIVIRVTARWCRSRGNPQRPGNWPGYGAAFGPSTVGPFDPGGPIEGRAEPDGSAVHIPGFGGGPGLDE